MITNQIVKTIKKKFEAKGYDFFDSALPYNLNIFGVRSHNLKVNSFDDYIYCVYRDLNLNWVIKQWQATTDPGITYMKSPINLRGTAILVPGQYKGAYMIDKHQGKYDALCQRLGMVAVYRDRNKDDLMDYTDIHKGMFGINIHKAGRNSTQVDGWSAGCQVFKRSADFDDFMRICRKAEKRFGNTFTYTLFDSAD